MQKKLSFATITALLLAMLAAAPVWAQTQSAFIETITLEMRDSSMEKWRGSMPLATPADPDAYVKQFTKWAAIIENGNGMGFSSDDLTTFESYKTLVADIQADAFPKIRANYYQMYKPFFDNYGLTGEYLKITMMGPGQNQMRITSEAFADPDFLKEFQQGIGPSWPYCRFKLVELYAETPEGTGLAQAFNNNPAIGDHSILLYTSRKDFRVVE